MNHSRRSTVVWQVFAALLLFCASGLAQDSLDLSGSWRFGIDGADRGLQEHWWLYRLGDFILLPGSMAENMKGGEVSPATPWAGGIVDRSWYTSERFAPYRMPGNIKLPFGLTPVRVYQGAAWYQREVTIPLHWRGKQVVLSLERVHWESRLWVDSSEVGMQNGLSTPHEYNLTSFLQGGRHTLTLRVDNRIGEIDIGRNAHSITDHTQTDWNGIVGRMTLRALPAVTVGDVRIDPDVPGRSIRIRTLVKGVAGIPSRAATIGFRVVTDAPPHEQRGRLLIVPFGGGDSRLAIDTVLELGPRALLWDEVHPTCYRLEVHLSDASGQSFTWTYIFGLRSFTFRGTRFRINDRPTFLRGTLDFCMFPLTGYPSTRVQDWEKIMRAIKAHGMNHVRFHSWCPPEAAFVAADRLGLYLQIECALWTRVGDGKPVDRWLAEESERIVRTYGNHPSFCLMAAGNEPSGSNMNGFLDEFVRHWKDKDNRRLYTSAAGWPQLPGNDFQSTMYPRIQVWGAGLHSIINREAPQTQFDFRDIVGKEEKPVVAHETGQWCAYPNLREIPKYTGVLRAGNYEIIRDDLQERGMITLADSFLLASGKLQALCYKADIEAALRTPGMAGFQLLGLHDFPGQGTAPVGVLDLFSEPKGYVSAEEFRHFCNATVPLVRMKSFVYSQGDTLYADVEVAHFGPSRLSGVLPAWRITDPGGMVIARGTFARRDIELDNCQPIGRVVVPLAGVDAPRQFKLTVTIDESHNAWDFWVYPSSGPARTTSPVTVTDVLDSSMAAHLQAGATVLLSLGRGRVAEGWGGEVALGFSSIFWNTTWTSGQAPHTLGVLCNPSHPALAGFPTEYHSNYQWWDLLAHGSVIHLDSVQTGLRPLVRVVDDWNKNRNLALMFEAQVGKGRLVVSGADLLTDLEHRPAARQMRRSLEAYMAGTECRPEHHVDVHRLMRAFLH
jgi:hypothetical protein